MPNPQTPTSTPGLPAPAAPITSSVVTNLPSSMPDPAQTSSTDPDVYRNLLEMKFAGIPFPAIEFHENGSQDLAIHKYPNLDSARVENTGRNPSSYICRAVLTNNIYPSGLESWKQGDLFPRVFELLLNTLYDSTGYHILQHPFLGNRNVQVQGWKYQFIGKGPRDGVFMDMAFIETIGDDDLNASISAPSTLADMQNAAGSIDVATSATDLKPMNPPNLNLGQLFSKISGLIRNAVSFPQQTLIGLNTQIVQINSSFQGAVSSIATALPQLAQTGQAIVNQNKGLILHGPISNAYYYDKAFLSQLFNFSQDALNAVYNTATALNANAAAGGAQFIQNNIAFTIAMIQYYQSLNRVETATVTLNLFQFLYQLQQALANLYQNNRNYKIKTYVVMFPTSLFALSRVLNNTIGQLLQLNGSTLNKTYIVQEGTVLQYYQG